MMIYHEVGKYRNRTARQLSWHKFKNNCSNQWQIEKHTGIQMFVCIKELQNKTKAFTI